jgi:hypothetical protein
VTVAAVLLAYAACVGMLGSRFLGRAGWTARAPLLAIVTYLTALTTAAVQTLDPGQLDAVLAHERAHLTGGHHRLLGLARIGRQVLPFLPLMRDADEHIARLVELHADDTATRARDPRLLATALVVLATAASPAPALAAGATDSVLRIRRLLGPREPLGRARRQLVRATAAALALTPVLLALTPAVLALVLGRLPAA